MKEVESGQLRVENAFCVLACICIFLFSSCERRELTYGKQENTPFRMVLDWSALQDGEEKPQYIKALFFPVNGGTCIERYLSPDDGEISVPDGEYRIIVYNWRTNATVQTIQFRGDTYSNFEAYVAPRSTTLRSRNEPELPIIPQPDEQLYAWNTGDETVIVSNTAPVLRTRTLQGNELNVSMSKKVRIYTLSIHIKNTQYISNMHAAVRDAYGAVPLGDGTDRDERRYGIETTMQQGESESGVTTYHCRINSFELFDDKEQKLVVNITNTNDEVQQKETVITDAIQKADKGEVAPGEPQVVIPPESPIVVKPGASAGGGFTPPTVGDWEEKNEEIPL